jgi:hypothetical protein
MLEQEARRWYKRQSNDLAVRYIARVFTKLGEMVTCCKVYSNSNSTEHEKEGPELNKSVYTGRFIEPSSQKTDNNGAEWEEY